MRLYFFKYDFKENTVVKFHAKLDKLDCYQKILLIKYFYSSRYWRRDNCVSHIKKNHEKSTEEEFKDAILIHENLIPKQKHTYECTICNNRYPLKSIYRHIYDQHEKPNAEEAKKFIKIYESNGEEPLPNRFLFPKNVWLSFIFFNKFC